MVVHYAYGCILRYDSQISPEAQRGFLGGEIPLVKVDSLCAVDIHERERERDTRIECFFFHISLPTALKSCIHEISKMQLLNYLKYLIFFCITAVASNVYHIS